MVNGSKKTETGMWRNPFCFRVVQLIPILTILDPAIRAIMYYSWAVSVSQSASTSYLVFRKIVIMCVSLPDELFTTWNGVVQTQ